MTQDPLTAAVTVLFRSPETAIIAAGLLVAWTVGLIVRTGFSGTRPMVDALYRRQDAVLSTVQQGAPAASGEQQIEQVGSAFRTDHPALGALRDNWERFRRGLFVGPAGQPTASAAAADVFEPLDGSARTLEWWSNIVVAVGLTLTFLGLIAALAEATAAMRSGAGAIQPALVGLLTVATTKFWTSVGGVVGSVILRYVARRRRSRVLEAQRLVTDALDGWAPPVNLESLSLEHNRVLARLEQALAA